MSLNYLLKVWQDSSSIKKRLRNNITNISKCTYIFSDFFQNVSQTMINITQYHIFTNTALFTVVSKFLFYIFINK